LRRHHSHRPSPSLSSVSVQAAAAGLCRVCRLLLVSLAFPVLACGPTEGPAEASREAFFHHLLDRCHETYRGAAELAPENDQLFGSAGLSLELESCSETEIRIRFAVDEDRSRRWLFRRDGEGLLFLQFPGEDGDRANAETEGRGWGLWASNDGTELVQHFPDHRSRPDHGSSQGNRLWTLEIDTEADRLIYRMARDDEPRYRFVFHRDEASDP
jgi:hypothetical protein